MEKESQKTDWVDWWVYSVGINFLPLLASMLVSFLQYNVIDISALIGSGELVMCAFLILLSPMKDAKDFSQKGARWKLFAYLVRLLAFMELISYGYIKSNPGKPMESVYIFSVAFVFMSILSARLSENLPKGA